jgi:Ca2+-binding RTX toxin-like protein
MRNTVFIKVKYMRLKYRNALLIGLLLSAAIAMPVLSGQQVGAAPELCDGEIADSLIEAHSTDLKFVLGDSSDSVRVEDDVAGDPSRAAITINGVCQEFDLAGYDRVSFELGGGNDKYRGGQSSFKHKVKGGAGNDMIITGSNVDHIWGDEGDDRIFGHDSFDYLRGGAGHDYLDGGEGPNIVDGNAGLDYSPATYDEANDLESVELVGDDKQEFNAFMNKRVALPGKAASFATSSAHSYLSAMPLKFSIHRNYMADFGGDILEITGEDVKTNIVLADIDGLIYICDKISVMNGILGSGGFSTEYNCLTTPDDVQAVLVMLGDEDDHFDATLFSKRATVFGQGGDDTLLGGVTGDFLIGGDGKDKLYGGWGHDYLSDNGHGYEMLRATGLTVNSNDHMYGGPGDDVIMGGYGDDHLYGGDGDDYLAGNAGKEDRLYGNDGDDILIDDGGQTWGRRAKLYGDDGDDILVCYSRQCELMGRKGRDYLVSTSNGRVDFYGSTGNDYMFVANDGFPEGNLSGGNNDCYGAGKVDSCVKHAGGIQKATRAYGNVNNVWGAGVNLNGFSGDLDAFLWHITNVTDIAAWRLNPEFSWKNGL